jgi:hypothetical protein
MTIIRDFNDELHSLLEMLLARKLDSSQTEKLIDGVIRVATSILGMQMHRKSWRFHRSGMSTYDMALDIVAELVSGGEEDPCVMLRMAMERSLLKRGAELGQGVFDRQTLVVSSCKAIISRTITQNIPRFFAECDPERGAVLRRLRKHIARSPDIVPVTSVCGRWYCSAGRKDSMHLEPMPYDMMLSLPLEPKQGVQFESSVLHGLIKALDNQDRYRKAVLEMDVVNMIIDLASREYLTELEKEMDDIQHSLVEPCPDVSDLDHAVERALFSAGAWMREKMVETGKLSEYEAGAMMRAARRYLIDLREGETLSLYHYLKLSMPGLLYDHFRSNYRYRFRYFLSKIFTDIGSRILNDYRREGRKELA